MQEGGIGAGSAHSQDVGVGVGISAGSAHSQDSVVVMGTIARGNGVLRRLSARDIEACGSCDL